MNTSHSGVAASVMIVSSKGRGSCGAIRGDALLGGIGGGRLAHPGALGLSLPAMLHALAVAGAVAGQHALELVPVDGPVLPVAGRLVEAKVRIGDREAEVMRLRHGGVEKFL